MDNQPQPKRLYRSRTDKVIAGVCGGLGEYFEIDPLIFRILFLLLVLGGGSGILIYIILALVIPKAPGPDANPSDRTQGDNRPWGQQFSNSIKQNAQDLVQDIRTSARQGGLSNARVFLGAIIVIIGVLILLDQLFPVRWFRWDLFWPLIIIFIGVLILARRR